MKVILILLIFFNFSNLIAKEKLLLYCSFESKDEIISKGGIINELGKNNYKEINFVKGFKGNGLYLKGEHEDRDRTTWDQVFLPVNGLRTSKGTIEFMFKPVDWNMYDKCALHYLIMSAEKPNKYYRWKNTAFGKGFLEIGFSGWTSLFHVHFQKPFGFSRSMDWEEGWYTLKGKKIFDSDEWMKIKVIWDISRRIEGGKSIVFYINNKEIAFCDKNIPEDIPFMNYISIGMSGADHFLKDEETANMYQNACGIIDEFYIWNEPKITKLD